MDEEYTIERIAHSTPEQWRAVFDDPLFGIGYVRVETMTLAEFKARYPPPDIGPDVPGGGAV
mgnify:FL=1